MRDGVHIRLTLTRGVKITSGMDPRLNQSGCTLIVLAEHKAPVYDTSGLRLITSSIRRPRPDVLDPKIHHNNLINSILAKMQANLAGVDDARDARRPRFRRGDQRDEPVHRRAADHCGPHSGTHARTASPGRPCCGSHPRTASTSPKPDLSLTDFYTADEVFCTGTMGEIAGVTEIDGRRIGSGQPGPVTNRIAALYQAHARDNGVPVTRRLSR